MPPPSHNLRYKLVAPTRNGYAFWDIYDWERRETVVTIWEGIKNAERLARELLDQINKDHYAIQESSTNRKV